MRIVSLAKARAEGREFYFTGIPCAHGHVDIRRVKSRICRACDNADLDGTKRAWNIRHRDHEKARLSAFKATNRDRILAEARTVDCKRRTP